MKSTNWPEIVFHPSFFQRLNALAASIIPDEVTAEEAVSFALSAIVEEDWARCRRFEGGSSPETFLYSLSTNLVTDYARKVYGRQRPPAWLKRKGLLWLSLWKSLCLERQAVETVVDRHARNATRDIVLDAIREIRAQLPWCGVSNRVESIDADSSLANQADMSGDDEKSPDECLEYLANELLGQPSSEPGPESMLDVLTAINLSTEEALVLNLHFCRGLSFSEIGRRLGVAKQVPVRQTRKALQRARQELERRGIQTRDD